MTVDIIIVLSILGLAVLLFASERLRVDVVALLVLIALVLTGLVTSEQAVSGFSNPAVITVWAVFILSGGLTATGVAHRLGARISSVGGSDTRLVVVLMLVAGVLSGFMNNIGVAAMLLPAVMGIARQRSIPSSRLLLPLAYATLLGGMISLIGTPGNILISGMLVEMGLQPFGMFDYTPAGMALLLIGVLFMALAARFLLPDHDAMQHLVGATRETGNNERYPLLARMALLRLPQNSRLAGRTLAECRIARTLGLNVLSVRRRGRLHLAPTPDMHLAECDEVLVLGKLDQLEELSGSPHLYLAPTPPHFIQMLSESIGFAEMIVTPESDMAGKSVAQLDFRSRWGCVILAICRGGSLRRSNLRDEVIATDDELLLYGEQSYFAQMTEQFSVREVSATVVDDYHLHERLLEIRIPEGSPLAGQSLGESRLGLTFGLVALAIERSGESLLLPSIKMTLQAGDSVIVQGNPADLDVVRGLQEMSIERQPDIDIDNLTAGPMALVEVTLSPYATQVDQSLRDLRFREKFGMNVLAIWHRGKARFSDLGGWQLQMGDAMLMYGPRDNVQRLHSDPDILVLEEDGEEDLRRDKAPVAVILMVAVVFVTILGWLTLPIAAIIGATLMVLLGCLTMDEAYRYIEWKAVFLIAGMLPLGIALETTGAAAFLAQTMLDTIGDYGPVAVLAGLFALTALLAQFMPNPVIAVLIAPIAINAASGFGISPYAFVMAVALAASASFLSPIAHPANILVMGPGGYRFSDYVKAGFPLLLLLMVTAIVIIPIFWPFTPAG